MGTGKTAALGWPRASRGGVATSEPTSKSFRARDARARVDILAALVNFSVVSVISRSMVLLGESRLDYPGPASDMGVGTNHPADSQLKINTVKVTKRTKHRHTKSQCKTGGATHGAT